MCSPDWTLMICTRAVIAIQQQRAAIQQRVATRSNNAQQYNTLSQPNCSATVPRSNTTICYNAQQYNNFTMRNNTTSCYNAQQQRAAIQQFVTTHSNTITTTFLPFSAGRKAVVVRVLQHVVVCWVCFPPVEIDDLDARRK